MLLASICADAVAAGPLPALRVTSAMNILYLYQSQVLVRIAFQKAPLIFTVLRWKTQL